MTSISVNRKYLTDRLDFTMPEFVRLSWTSDRAREVWAPRFKRIIGMWAEVEWISAAFGIRNCALVTVSAEQRENAAKLWASRGLKALMLDRINISDSSPADGPSQKTANPHPCPVVLGSASSTVRFHEAWVAQDHEVMGTLLGYPGCCRSRFEERCISGKSIDPAWAMAAASSSASHAPGQIEVKGHLLANILWRPAGIRAVPHLPCRFDCAATIQFSRRFLNIGVELGFQDEIQWLQEILSWPVEWSGLHGIAELKTPLLKMCTRTDATAAKHVVRRVGEGYPKEGAQGVTFPYRMPPRPRVTSSPAFKRGLVQIQETAVVAHDAAIPDAPGFNTRSQ